MNGSLKKKVGHQIKGQTKNFEALILLCSKNSGALNICEESQISPNSPKGDSIFCPSILTVCQQRNENKTLTKK